MCCRACSLLCISWTVLQTVSSLDECLTAHSWLHRYVMFYEGVAKDGTRSIGVAVSRDGQDTWTRHPHPILSPSSQPGAWDGASVGAPCAVPMAGDALSQCWLVACPHEQ